MIAFTSPVPATVSGGTTYTPQAFGGASGNPVTFAIDGSSTSGCTYDERTGVVTLSLPAGTCIIDANQAGNASYLAAGEAKQTLLVELRPQAIMFTSPAPSDAVATGTYDPKATATSGLAVAITIDASSISVCALDAAGVVSFITSGKCTIDANQRGDSTFGPAAQAQQTVVVATATVKASAGVSRTLHYANNGWTLSSAARAKLKALARAIKATHLTRVTVTGYCSSPGTPASNMQLSIKRAATAGASLKKLVAALGVSGVRISLVGRGASDYAASPHTSPLNRRVLIVAR